MDILSKGTNLVRLDKTVLVFRSIVGSAVVVHLENVANGDNAVDVMYKIKTNNHLRYKVEPCMGRISAGKTTAIRFVVTKDPPLENGTSRDRFAFVVALNRGSENVSPQEFWKHNRKPSSAHKFRLGVEFIKFRDVQLSQIMPHTANEFVHVDKKEFEINIDESHGEKDRLTDTVRVFNTADDNVAFKVVTTAPNRFVVRPNHGCILKAESCLITLHRLEIPPPLPGLSKDRLQLRIAIAPDISEGMSSQFWSDRSEFTSVERINLPVRFLRNLRGGGKAEVREHKDEEYKLEPKDGNKMKEPKSEAESVNTAVWNEARVESELLVHVDKHEFEVHVEESHGKQARLTDTVRVVNTTVDNIAFKLVTTAPSYYVLRPNYGTIPQGECRSITLHRLEVPPPAVGLSNDRLQLHVALAPGVSEAMASQFWNDRSQDASVERINLRVRFLSNAHDSEKAELMEDNDEGYQLKRKDEIEMKEIESESESANTGVLDETQFGSELEDGTRKEVPETQSQRKSIDRKLVDENKGIDREPETIDRSNRIRRSWRNKGRLVSDFGEKCRNIDKVLLKNLIVSDLNRLIQVNKRQLAMSVEERGKDIFQIENISTDAVVFKVFSSNPCRYVVGPKLGTIEKGGIISIRVLLAEDTQRPTPGTTNDKIQVTAAPVLESTSYNSLRQFWIENERRKDLQRVKIKVRFMQYSSDPHVVPWRAIFRWPPLENL